MSYDAVNWPPLLYPDPIPQKELWDAQVPADWPLLVEEAPVPHKELWQALAPLTPPSQEIVQPVPTNNIWAAAPPIPNTTKYASQVTTQVVTYDQFNIVDRRLTPPDMTLKPATDVFPVTAVVLAPPVSSGT